MSVKRMNCVLSLTLLSMLSLNSLAWPIAAQDKADVLEKTLSLAEKQFNELDESLARYTDMSDDQCRKAAQQRDPKAMVVLAKRLLKALERGQKCPEAIELLTKASDLNYVPAIHRLGRCHYYGLGTAEDNSKAFACFQRAAEAGFILAQHDLGLCYNFGNGVDSDTEQAFKLFKQAAQAGELDAMYTVGVYLHEGIAASRDDAEAIRWWQKAAERGHLLAMNNLGIAWLEGQVVEVDKQKAVEYFRQGAEQGNAHCQYNLGTCYRDGTGVITDYAVAEELLQKSAEQNFKIATKELAKLRSARAEAARFLDAGRGRNPSRFNQPSRPTRFNGSDDASEAASRQMRDYQNQLGGSFP